MATRFIQGNINSQAAPAGTIQAYGGTSAPTGWLVCDGTPISRSVYAALFVAVGIVHGSGDGSTTFHLPDYRGRILRGRDGGIARDPDRASRTAANSGGATGDAVGSVQAEATKKNGLTASASTSAVTGVTGTNAASSVTGTVGGSDGTHSHNFNTNGASVRGSLSVSSSGGAISDIATGAGTVANFFIDSSGSGHGHAFTSGSAAAQAWSQSGSGTAAAQTITIAAGDNETRPLNAYVNYIIKV